MLKDKSNVRNKADKLASRSGWVGYAVGVVTVAIIAGFGLPLWGALLVGLPAGFLWGYIESRLTDKFMDSVYES